MLLSPSSPKSCDWLNAGTLTLSRHLVSFAAAALPRLLVHSAQCPMYKNVHSVHCLCPAINARQQCQSASSSLPKGRNWFFLEASNTKAREDTHSDAREASRIKFPNVHFKHRAHLLKYSTGSSQKPISNLSDFHVDIIPGILI